MFFYWKYLYKMYFVCSCYFILLNHKHKSKDLCGRWRKASCSNKIKFKWDFSNKIQKNRNGQMFVSCGFFSLGIMWQFYNLSTSLSTLEQNVIDTEFNHVNNRVF